MKSQLTGKEPDAGKAGGEGDDRDEMIGWHHGLHGHEFEQAQGDGEGQGSLACCSPWGHKESNTTEKLNSKIIHPTVNYSTTLKNFKYLLSNILSLPS